MVNDTFGRIHRNPHVISKTIYPYSINSLYPIMPDANIWEYDKAKCFCEGAYGLLRHMALLRLKTQVDVACRLIDRTHRKHLTIGYKDVIEFGKLHAMLRYQKSIAFIAVTPEFLHKRYLSRILITPQYRGPKRPKRRDENEKNRKHFVESARKRNR